MSNRLAILRVVPESIVGLGTATGFRVVEAPIPADARIVHRFVDAWGDLVLWLESERFAELAVGDPMPVLPGIAFDSIDYVSPPRIDQGGA